LCSGAIKLLGVCSRHLNILILRKVETIYSGRDHIGCTKRGWEILSDRKGGVAFASEPKSIALDWLLRQSLAIAQVSQRRLRRRRLAIAMRLVSMLLQMM
jgi:hypothetical protein